MNIQNDASTAWSFKIDDETALRAHVQKVYQSARECTEKPAETTAVSACGAARNVWDAAEGMIHADLEIDADLLQQAIDGIGLCIDALTDMELQPTWTKEVKQHLRDMIGAMKERRGDLLVLFKEGRMAFKRRLRPRQGEAT